MRTVTAAAVMLFAFSCSSPVAPVCKKGDTRACVGPGGCQGGQACLEDGSGFGACDCGSTGGGSGGGTAGGSTGGGSTGGGGTGGGTGGGGADTVAPVTTPSPAAGSYMTAPQVRLDCTDSGSGCRHTYFTLDGSTPTASSTEFSAPIQLTGTTTVRFFSVDGAGNIEAVQSATYLIDSTPPVTTASHFSGVVPPNTMVTLSCADEDGGSGCVSTYFTVDGGTPSVSSLRYSTPIALTDATTLRFFSVDGAGNVEVPNTATYSILKWDGLVEAHSVTLKNMGGAGVDGNGVRIAAAFQALSSVVAPVLEEQPGSPVGCHAWQYTPAQASAAAGVDDGPVQVTASDGSPVFPACTFTGGRYQCISSSMSAVGGSVTTVAAGVSTLNLSGASFTAADVGRYVRFSGTGVAALDTGAYAGGFPIVQVPSATTLVFAGISYIGSLSAGTATVIAGLGPIPGSTPTTYFADNEELTLSKPAGSLTPAFSKTFPAPAGIADSFTLGTSSGRVLPANIPVDGSAFTVGCDSVSSCGSGTATDLVVKTTDAPVAGIPFGLPPPVTKQVVVRCRVLGTTSVTVPAAYSALLSKANSGATRFEATFFRSEIAVPYLGLWVAAGHAEVGYTNVP